MKKHRKLFKKKRTRTWMHPRYGRVKVRVGMSKKPDWFFGGEHPTKPTPRLIIDAKGVGLTISFSATKKTKPAALLLKKSTALKIIETAIANSGQLIRSAS